MITVSNLSNVRIGINSPDSLDNVCILTRKQVAEQDVTAEEVPVTASNECSDDVTTISSNQTISGMGDQGVVSESALADLMFGTGCWRVPDSESEENPLRMAQLSDDMLEKCQEKGQLLKPYALKSSEKNVKFLWKDQFLIQKQDECSSKVRTILLTDSVCALECAQTAVRDRIDICEV